MDFAPDPVDLDGRHLVADGTAAVAVRVRIRTLHAPRRTLARLPDGIAIRTGED